MSLGLNIGFDIDLQKYLRATDGVQTKKLGRVSRVVGLTIESIGPDARVGHVCTIRPNINSEPVKAEVVGFNGTTILLMPYGDMSGIGPGSIVEAVNKPLSVEVSEELLGRVVDGLGKPMDGLTNIKRGVEFDTTNTPPDPMIRNRISENLTLGIRAIDGLLTVGKGQRMGIFAGSGVGKSTLMGMIARNTKADINVIALIGERGREVREFIEKDLGEEGLRRSVVVVATSDQPALVRLKAAEVATSIAEFFRENGKDVLLLMDSLTRFAMAQREIGLATGEPPVSRGYTPSVYAKMPKLLERAGNSDKGSITGIYTVLVDGDDMTEPVTDTARGILDGHILLNRKLANKGQYPPIDVMASISRVMGDVVTDEHKTAAMQLKKKMAVYADAEDLINIGAYVQGSSPDIDDSINKYPEILSFITQGIMEKADFEDSVQTIKNIVMS